ncbi:MAG: flavoprotein [Endomicrobiia bacterium]
MSKNILIGITAGIALYKVCDLIRKLKNENYTVKCIMTENATKLISPMLLQELAQDKVYIDMFSQTEYLPTHISLSQWADLVVVVPCSCNTISKLAIAKTEDLLTATIYAIDREKTKVLLCPSMNVNMWKHPVTQKNISILKKIGYNILEPQKGKLLCGKEGEGRLPEVEEIFDYIKKMLKK